MLQQLRAWHDVNGVGAVHIAGIGWLSVCTLAGMAGFRSHRDFVAWQLARELRLALIPLCWHVLRGKDYRLHDNMREAARSAPRNIAEGFGRYRHKDFANFVRIAKASEVEILEHLLEAHICGYLRTSDLGRLERPTKRAIKTANGLIRYLESTPDPEKHAGTRRTPGT